MLKLNNLCFSYTPGKPVLQDLCLELAEGELLAVMGPSGCGKSTLLNLIAGLLRPTSGTLESDSRRMSYVFQEPRLFPWLTVEQNLRAVLPHKADAADSAAANAASIADALALVELPDAGRLYPSELSGGMKTRISLARAVVYGGDLMLLDEPFAALNEELRADLLRRLKTRLKEKGTSAILVTHQREDAEAFADRIFRLPPATAAPAGSSAP